MKEKISVIVPIYNVEKYLDRCINSLINQTHDNIEILLIDDCSTDGSAEIAQKYEKTYPDKCTYVRMSENSGVSAVRNYGLDICQGDWVSFVDSDDWVKEEYISSMYEAAKRDDADIVMSGCTYVWENGKSVEMFMPPTLTTETSHRDKVALCRCSVTAKLLRRSFLDTTKIRLSVNIRRLEELSMMVPLFTYTDKISVIAESYYLYNQRSNSSSNQNGRNTNLDFFMQSVNRMYELAKSGFDESLEYRAITELMYGMIMTMIRCGKTRKEVMRAMRNLNDRFSNWSENRYLVHLPKLKRLFLSCVKKKRYAMLWLMVTAWNIKQRF